MYKLNMGKKFRCISHIERMMDKELRKSARKDCTYGRHSRFEEVRVLDSDTGYIGKEVRLVDYDPADAVAGYKYTDFSIENLVATGAIDGLKMCKLNGDTFASVDNMVSTLNSIDIPINE